MYRIWYFEFGLHIPSDRLYGWGDLKTGLERLPLGSHEYVIYEG